jgi:serralysin
MAAFGKTAVNYHEDRADGAFAWDVRYDLTFLTGTVVIDLDVRLTGFDPGAAIRNIWETGTERIWNNKVFFDDGTTLIPVELRFDFVASGQHQSVEVHAGSGGADMANWYQTPAGWGPDYHDEIAAHEVGHMLGNFDEYAGGATYAGFTRTNSLMSDLTVAEMEDYFWTVEWFTEQFGFGGANALSTVAAIVGDAFDNVLVGFGGREGFYGFGGLDRIRAGAGNDFLDGGLDSDRLTGGSGNDKVLGDFGDDILRGGLGLDTLRGGVGFDRFVFDRTPGVGNVDQVLDFASGFDSIRLDNSVMARLGAAGALDARFFALNAATDGNDFVVYVQATGGLFYDADGNRAGAAVQIANLGAGTALALTDIFVA